MKPPLQTHDTCNNKATDHFKMMKKSRSFKRYDHEGHKRTTPRRRDEAAISSVLGKESLISAAAPNYMKSTRSWEARKEGTSRIIPVERVSNKSSSRMDNKVRSLTKTLSFQPARASQLAKPDAQRPTCSSTLKDYKFPPNLMLNGTESEGTSVFKVCPYTYCSLNGCYHHPAAPLKRLSAKRRAIKTQKEMNVEQVGHLVVINCSSADDTVDVEDFLIEIHVQDIDVVKTADEGGWISGSKIVSSVGEQAADEAGFGNELGRESDEQITIKGILEEVKGIAPADADSLSASEDLDEVDSSTVAEEQAKPGSDPERESSVGSSLDELSLWTLDMVWEEGQISTKECGKGDMPRKTENECQDLTSEDEGGCAAAELFGELLIEIKADQSSHVSRDEILEFQDWLSDLGSSIDGDNQRTYISSEQQLEEAATVDETIKCYSETEKSLVEDSERREDTTICRDQKTLIQEQETKLLTNSEVNPQNVIEISGYDEESSETDSEEEHEGVTPEIQDITPKIQDMKMDSLEDQMQVNEATAQPEMVVEQKETIANSSGINQPLLEENHDAVIAMEKEDVGAPDETETSSITEAEASPNNSITSSEEIQQEKELLDIYERASNRARRSKLLMEDADEGKGFNPREPNFLPVEPDPESEKVDLRHQEIDDRKDASEWMLDYALQKAISNLAPARKKKVALMVTAFETVIPVPRYETHHLRQSTAGFPHMKLMQACS